MEQYPNQAEIEFLTLAYNKFYDIYEEIITEDKFWEKSQVYRLNRIKNAFSIYGEVQSYEPIKWVLNYMEKSRPPMESVIAKDLFKCIRNILIHFPFFDSWDNVYVTKNLINWERPGQSIDKFLEKYVGHSVVKYRYWEAEKKQMTYLSIRFPVEYNLDSKIYLKEFLTEKEGVKFSLILMKKVMDTYVESVN
ncbi:MULTISPECIES: hypothetical protein [Lactobacillales]|uniref:hypothetical protein n=1 Tax=Lactobacillales TaxID=186826 RepID=UPI0011EEA35B|nr:MULTISPECIES: hypothetical protein [unclassified Carnobacterium]KAF3299085.1 hypothetical protein FPV22_08360 [Carnobacterium sp. PL26RED25]KAF3304139.1 hypothetical protein FPV24_08360 [Carnobacterium sp. PL24RED07]